MFRNTYQRGFLSILYSCGSSPLELWDMHVKNGYIRRITDEEIKSLALEIAGTNVATTYIYCPADPKKILDDKNMHRRFRVSNFQSTTRVRPFCTSMPIGLSGGWNQIQFNLCDFTRRAYGTNYIETTRMQIHANCRIRRIYFADRLYSEDEMPEEFKLFFPVHRKKCVREERIPKKPSIPERELPPVIIAKAPTFDVEMPMEELIEPTIPEEPDLIEEAALEMQKEMREILTTEDEEEDIEEEKEDEKEEIEEEEAEAEEEIVVLDEEEIETTDIVREDEEDEEEEETADVSKLEKTDTEDEAND